MLHGNWPPSRELRQNTIQAVLHFCFPWERQVIPGSVCTLVWPAFSEKKLKSPTEIISVHCCVTSAQCASCASPMSWLSKDAKSRRERQEPPKCFAARRAGPQHGKCKSAWFKLQLSCRQLRQTLDLSLVMVFLDGAASRSYKPPPFQEAHDFSEGPLGSLRASLNSKQRSRHAPHFSSLLFFSSPSLEPSKPGTA